ncbi:glycine, glutamate and proline-rich protein-like isoform X1 [Physella acuta]|uniref:glycine, glutamate and proline-rich protein-like isoform X1 n=1 Tax=Physella acuta TaxID=109671 RepID=UPI0027DD5811|nr:glycine, glutamate and proline-rich protein-like isoform X1 [Physella acuta]
MEIEQKVISIVLLIYVLVAMVACSYNIDLLQPTGKKIGGVPASEAAVQADLPALNSLKACYEQVGQNTGIPAAVIAAIASRETRGGATIASKSGWSSDNRYYGILQCNIRIHCDLESTSVPWNSCDHIQMIISKVLLPYIAKVKATHPNWTPEKILQGGVAAYNFGVSNVHTWTGIDVGTTGGDYSNDVMARAQWLKRNGW